MSQSQYQVPRDVPASDVTYDLGGKLVVLIGLMLEFVDSQERKDDSMRGAKVTILLYSYVAKLASIEKICCASPGLDTFECLCGLAG